MRAQRTLGPFTVSAIGLGCMNLSHAYGVPPARVEASRLLLEALDLGCTHFDTAALYGFGANETLIGETLADQRSSFTLASKCGMRGVDGKREINGRPQVLKETCEQALKRLRTDVIDLYYLHRWDKNVPIEESVGGLAELVQEGKIRSIGLSEVSASTLRRAHAEHPITAVQSEYSLWTRNPEIAVLDACAELGVSFVAFSPVARGFLADTPPDPSTFVDKDIRRPMPRFQGEAWTRNLALLDGVRAVAAQVGCTVAQLALAWLLAKRQDILPIPGTTSLAHLREDLTADTIALDAAVVARLDALINHNTVTGGRYNAATQLEIDTEEFA